MSLTGQPKYDTWLFMVEETEIEKYQLMIGAMTITHEHPYRLFFTGLTGLFLLGFGYTEAFWGLLLGMTIWTINVKFRR